MSRTFLIISPTLTTLDCNCWFYFLFLPLNSNILENSNYAFSHISLCFSPILTAVLRISLVHKHFMQILFPLTRLPFSSPLCFTNSYFLSLKTLFRYHSGKTQSGKTQNFLLCTLKWICIHLYQHSFSCMSPFLDAVTLARDTVPLIPFPWNSQCSTHRRSLVNITWQDRWLKHP